MEDRTAPAALPWSPFITEFPLPTASSTPHGITSGPDGNLWFTEALGNRIGRITPDGTVTEFSIPTPNSCPNGITAGPDGALWFTETLANQIGRITPDGTVTEFSIPTPSAYLFQITAGPDGNLWFTEAEGNHIGRITPAGVVTEFAVPTPGGTPVDITVGPDGSLWFSEGRAARIGRITTDGVITEVTVPNGADEYHGLTAGADGNLWFTQTGSGVVTRLTSDGVTTEFAASGGDIWCGPDGSLWVQHRSELGRVTPDGKTATFSLPTADDAVWSLTGGPDGNLWFTYPQTNRIGRLELPIVPFDAVTRPVLIGPAGTFTQQDPTFTWTPVAGADHYSLRLTDLATKQVVADGHVVGTSWVAPSSLAGGHTYRWLVQAVAPDGAVGAWSAYRDVAIVHPMTGSYGGTYEGTVVDGGYSGPVTGAVTFRVSSAGVITVTSPGPGFGSVTFAGDAQASGSRLEGIPDSTYAMIGVFDVSSGVGLAGGTWSAVWGGGGASGTWAATATTPAVLATPSGIGPVGSVASTTPVFTWNPVPGADTYEVRLDNLSTGRYGLVDVKGIGGTSFTAPLTLTIGQRYQWRVRAWRANGTASAWGVAIPFTALLARPVLIGPVGTQTDLSPTFRWAAVPGADSYRVQLTDVTSRSVRLVDQLVVGTTFVAPSALVLGHRYQWTVQARHASGLYSPVGSAAFTATVGTPSAITPTVSLQNARPTFRWTSAVHADYYEVWVDNLSRSQFPVLRNLRVAGTSWTFGTPLVPGNVYRWRVRGRTEGGVAGPWSGWSTFTVTPLGRPALTGPSGVTQPTRPVFTWSPVSAADYYDVQVTDLTTGRLAARGSHVVGTEWIYANPLVLGHRYRWQVRAWSENGDYSPWSASLSFTATLALSANSAGPGQALTVRGAGFDPALPTFVVFTAADGTETRVPVPSVTATQLVVAVPPFIDGETAVVGPGTVSVSVAQQKPDGTFLTTAPISSDFTIADLPQTDVAAGTWTAAYLDRVLTLLDKVIPDYQAIGIASGGAVDVSQLVSTLQGWRDQLAVINQQVVAIRNGEPVSIDLGTLHDVPIAVNADSLALMDRMLAAMFEDGGSAALRSALPVGLTAPRAAPEAFTPEEEVADRVHRMFQMIETGEREFVEHFERYGGLFVAVGSLAVLGTFGGAAAGAFAAVATVGLFGATIYLPALRGPCWMAASNFIKQGKAAGLHDYHVFLAKGGAKVIAAGVVTLMSEMGHPSEFFADLSLIVAKLKTAYDVYKDDVAPKLEKYFTPIATNLPPPLLTLSPEPVPGFSFTALAGEPNPTGTLTVANGGAALSSLYCKVTSTSTRVVVGDTTPHYLAVGESVPVPFTVNIAGLVPGRYAYNLSAVWYRGGVARTTTVPVVVTVRGIRLDGYVKNAVTGRVIAGASVRVVYNTATYTAVSGGTGYYRLYVPPELRDQTPYVAAQVSAPGYVDRVVAVNLTLGNQTRNVALQPVKNNVVLVEAGLHHLGDSNFSTPLNAGLQTLVAEGAVFTTTFTVAAGQLPPTYTAAWVELTVNGAECGDVVRVNGTEITGLYNSVAGPQTVLIPFEIGLLHEGVNEFRIEAVTGIYGDLDDFEFSNVHIWFD